MSIDSTDYLPSSSSVNRAPPPQYSTQALSQAQRKRPALSNLGMEASLGSDAKTPNTPTPYVHVEGKSESSDVLFHLKSSPANVPIFHQHQSSANSIREPQLNCILEALNDFQHHYDLKQNKIERLEAREIELANQLQEKNQEIQLTASERIAAFKQLEAQKQQLQELTAKLVDFQKYEGLIEAKFSDMEGMMAEMGSVKVKYKQLEAEATESLNEKQRLVDDALKTIQEFRRAKEDLEVKLTQQEDAQSEAREECKLKLKELSEGLQREKAQNQTLSGEKEIASSDLKSITEDRDRLQRDCSTILKEITELALMNGVEADLGSLDRSVAWIKGQCEAFKAKFNKTEKELERLCLEMAIVREGHEKDLTEKEMELKVLQSACQESQDKISQLNERVKDQDLAAGLIEEFKTKAKGYGFEGFDQILKKLSIPDEMLKERHERELNRQKEEFSRLLREEKNHLQKQKEDLEAELIKLKSSSSIASSSQKKPTAVDPDLTAIIRDLKGPDQDLKRPAAPSQNNKTFAKRRLTRNSRSTKVSLASPTKSPTSVNSSDIWSLFK